MTEKVRAAIVGLGRWGELLVSSVDNSERMEFTAAVTRTPSKVEDFCATRNMSLSDNLEDVCRMTALMPWSSPHLTRNISDN